MGHDCEFILYDESDRHKIRRLEDYYLSYNFSNSSVWHITDTHGYTPNIILQQIMPIIRQHESRLGLEPDTVADIPAGADGWTACPEVYLTHLTRLRKICENLIDQYGDDTDHIFFWVDSVAGTGKIPPDFQGNPRHIFSEDLEDAPDGDDGEIVIPFRHPIKGNILIKTFADAAEAYTLHMLAGSTVMAAGFLKIAEELKRRGK